jgi:uncharacterized damage-inducible protein DinB
VRISTILAAGALATCIGASTLAAQTPQAGWRAEFLNSLGGAERKYVALAEATPWDKYSWRPAEGVRSVCEVFLHISGANYMFATPLGAATPANVDVRNIEKCPASRDQVVSTLKTSFAHLRNAVTSTPDAQADTGVEIFGMKMTKRGLLLFTAEHMGEHLGQSIAYARVNKIVPPWSRGG